MGEPLIRYFNVMNAAIASGAFILGFKKLAAVMLVLNGLDIVGWQVSRDYRAKVTDDPVPIAGLAFIPAIRNQFRQ